MPQGISLTFNRVKERRFSNLTSILEEVICTLFQIIVSSLIILPSIDRWEGKSRQEIIFFTLF